MQHGERDLRLALELLSDALRVGDDGVLRSHRVEPGSLEEREAKDAIARVLWAAVREGRVQGEAWVICRQLVRLLASDSADPYELVLRRRRGQKGPAPSPAIEGLIISQVLGAVQSGCKKEVAVEDAAHYFDLSASTVWAILKRHEAAETFGADGNVTVLLQSKRATLE
jgi:hypothetical protein